MASEDQLIPEKSSFVDTILNICYYLRWIPPSYLMWYNPSVHGKSCLATTSISALSDFWTHPQIESVLLPYHCSCKISVYMKPLCALCVISCIITFFLVVNKSFIFVLVLVKTFGLVKCSVHVIHSIHLCNHISVHLSLFICEKISSINCNIGELLLYNTWLVLPLFPMRLCCFLRDFMNFNAVPV